MDLQRLDQHDYGSPYAEQLRRGFKGLRFSGLLEKDFRDFYVAQNLPRARLSGLIALIIVLAVTCIDLLLGTSTGGPLNTLRLGILCPLLVIIGAAISVPAAQRYYTEVVAVGVTLIGFVAATITSVSNQGEVYARFDQRIIPVKGDTAVNNSPGVFAPVLVMVPA